MLLLFLAGLVLSATALPDLPFEGKVKMEPGEFRQLQSFEQTWIHGLHFKLHSPDPVSLCISYTFIPMSEVDADPRDIEICKKKGEQFKFMDPSPDLELRLVNDSEQDLEVSYSLEFEYVFSYQLLIHWTFFGTLACIFIGIALHSWLTKKQKEDKKR